MKHEQQHPQARGPAVHSSDKAPQHAGEFETTGPDPGNRDVVSINPIGTSATHGSTIPRKQQRNLAWPMGVFDVVTTKTQRNSMLKRSHAPSLPMQELVRSPSERSGETDSHTPVQGLPLEHRAGMTGVTVTASKIRPRSSEHGEKRSRIRAITSAIVTKSPGYKARVGS